MKSNSSANFCLLVVIAFVCGFTSDYSFARVDSQTDWKTRPIGNVQLIFDAKQQDLADFYSRKIQAAQQSLHVLFPQQDSRTAFVLMDRTDPVNGFATPFPYSMIQVFPTLPGPGEGLSDFADWSFELVVHEYTHTLAIEPRRGFFRGLQYVFGSISVPNILLPRWWHEGLAVELETRFTQAGRLRSPLQDGMITALVNDGKWMSTSFPEINEISIPTWPYGNRPYLYGSVLWSYMLANQKDLRSIYDLTNQYSGRVPYLLSGPEISLWQSSYPSLFRQALLDSQKRADDRMKTLKTQALNEPVDIEGFDAETSLPSLSPDGLRLAFIARDSTLRRRIQILQRKSLSENFSRQHLINVSDAGDADAYDPGVPLPNPDGPGGGTILRLSWSSDSQQIVFDQLEPTDRFFSGFKVFRYDLRTRKREQITLKDRAREPALSPDGKWLAYCLIEAGKTSLAILHIPTGKTQLLVSSAIEERVSWPIFRGNSEVIFSWRRKGGEGLYLARIGNLTEGLLTAPQRIDTGKKIAQFPFLDSKQILYFVSPENGVYNLYRLPLTPPQAGARLPAEALSHSASGITSFTVEPSGSTAYATRLTSSGWKVGKLDLQKRPRGERLPLVAPLFADRYPTGEADSESVLSDVGSTRMGQFSSNGPSSSPDTSEGLDPLSATEDYSPLPYLWPRWWLPVIASTGRNSYLGFTTGASDPVGKHAYSVDALWNDDTRYGSYDIDYLNNTTEFMIPVSASDIVTSRGSALSRVRSLSAMAQQEFLFGGELGAWGVGYVTSDSSQGNVYSKQQGPRLAIQYSNASQSGSMISPESGFRGFAQWTEYLSLTNSEAFRVLDLRWSQYFSRWLPERHAILAQASGRLANRELALSNYVATTSFVFGSNRAGEYLLRGFPANSVQSSNLVSGNLEYRLPLAQLSRGWGVLPLFLRRMHSALVVDATWSDGQYWPQDGRQYLEVPRGTWFANYGAEFTLESTLGYHLAAPVFAGIYWPMENGLGFTRPQLAVGLRFAN